MSERRYTQMKVLVVYDSVYGNTEEIAQAIEDALHDKRDVEMVKASEIKSNHLIDLDLIIIGSPTHGGRFTEAIQDFFNNISESMMNVVNVAAFDTRTASSRWLVSHLEKIFGHAANRIVDVVKKQGGILIVEPEGFIVEGTKGPLRIGEIKRAENWARDIVQKKEYLKT